MIDLGQVDSSTVRQTAQRISDIVCRATEAAVFVASDRTVTVIGYHDRAYAARLDRNAGDLVGRYQVDLEDGRRQQRAQHIREDLEVRMAEIEAQEAGTLGAGELV